MAIMLDDSHAEPHVFGCRSDLNSRFFVIWIILTKHYWDAIPPVLQCDSSNLWTNNVFLMKLVYKNLITPAFSFRSIEKTFRLYFWNTDLIWNTKTFTVYEDCMVYCSVLRAQGWLYVLKHFNRNISVALQIVVLYTQTHTHLVISSGRSVCFHYPAPCPYLSVSACVTSFLGCIYFSWR